VLLASAGVRSNKSLRRNTLGLIAKVAKYPTYLLPRRYRNKLRRGVYEALGSDMLLLPHMEPTFKKIIREDVRHKAKQITVPTLLIYGSADNQTPISEGRLLAEAIPNSKLEIIEGANHFLHHDSTGQVSRLIKAFLREKDA
jgi:pimeloyl-ACP methyl ester carboxylesterase